MAKQQTDDELNLRRKARRRLIGAVALTLAVVVILPMVLDSEPKISGKDIDLSIPDPNRAGKFVPRVAISDAALPSGRFSCGGCPRYGACPGTRMRQNRLLHRPGKKQKCRARHSQHRKNRQIPGTQPSLSVPKALSLRLAHTRIRVPRSKSSRS